jgi:hypothetical protein
LPAQIEYRDDGAAYITKTCPDHGYEEAMVERSWEFWKEIPQLDPNNRTYAGYNNITMIEVTDRCNVMCKHCYHSPDNKISDLPVDVIVNRAIRQQGGAISLIGAEPTMRDDLHEIVEGIISKKPPIITTVGMVSNGIRLADRNYFKKLEDAGMNDISISVHNPKYHKDAIWKKISKGLDNLLDSKIQIGQIGFTVETQDEVDYAVEKILWFKENGYTPVDFCIRSAGDIGTKVLPEEEVFASDLARMIANSSSAKSVSFEKHPNYGSNPYHVGYILAGMNVQVIHWPGARSVDTRWMNMGPWAEFIPNSRGSFVIQAILRDGWKKGWWQGQRLITNH